MSIHHRLLAALSLCVFSLASLATAQDDWPLKDAPDEAQLAWQSLLEADVFSFGGIGIKGELSKGELAMHVLSRRPNAVAIFKLAIEQAAPEGRLYALTALHALDHEAYKWADEATVETGRVFLQSGCAGYKEPVADVHQRIEAGTYDEQVPKRH